MPRHTLRPALQHDREDKRILRVRGVGADYPNVAAQVQSAISQSDGIVKERERAAGVVSDAALFGYEVNEGGSPASAVSGVSAIHSLTVNGTSNEIARKEPPKLSGIGTQHVAD